MNTSSHAPFLAPFIILLISLLLVLGTSVSTELFTALNGTYPESGCTNFGLTGIQNSTTLYRIELYERGLARDTIWSVTVTDLSTGKAITNTSNINTIDFFLPLGMNYSYFGRILLPAPKYAPLSRLISATLEHNMARVPSS